MSKHIFIDRENETAFLGRAYSSPRPELLILYGRRRIGKTELMLRFMESRPGLYFLSTTEGSNSNLQAFVEKTADAIGDASLKGAKFDGWLQFFTLLSRNSTFLKIIEKSKFIICIDEFTYLVQENAQILSIFQKAFDEVLSELNIMLVLAGSAVGIMEEKVMAVNTPLYGRRTGQWFLAPLQFRYLREFLDYGAEDLMKTWFTIGGVPRYLLEFERTVPFWENVRRHIIEKGSYLNGEGEILLRSDFREPKNYRLILKAISLGRQTFGEISDHTGMDKSAVSKYLDTLRSTHYIESVRSVTSPLNSKKTNYVISDPYLNFWFRYVDTNLTDIEAGRSADVMKRIKSSFADYAGHMFESLTMEMIRAGTIIEGISFTTMGRWWGRNPGKQSGEDQEEIDIVALDEPSGTAMFAECKWRERPVDPGVYLRLKEKSRLVRWRNDSRKEQFALFSRAGFTDEMRRIAKDDGVMLFDPEGMLRRSGR